MSDDSAAIAMQYSFALPADYDMSRVERRIRERGPAFDGLPGLAFKTFLVARKDDDALPGADNLYAPFYLWQSPGAMRAFLCGERFRALVDAFGWPSVDVWTPLAQHSRDGALEAATFASRETRTLAPHTRMDALHRDETHAVEAALADGAVYALSAFEPTSWRVVRFTLWPQPPRVADETRAQRYRVLHVSRGVG